MTPGGVRSGFVALRGKAASCRAAHVWNKYLTFQFPSRALDQKDDYSYHNHLMVIILFFFFFNLRSPHLLSEETNGM